MNKLDKFLGQYFILALPVLGVFAFFSFIYGADNLSQAQGVLRHFNDLVGWILMIWILTSLYLFTRMILSVKFRDQTIKRFIRLKETDERESLMSGEAAKLSMISTFALMTFLIFLSSMTVSIGKVHGEDLFKNDQQHFISIGFDPLTINKKQRSYSNNNRTEFFTYSGLPVPTTIILLFVLCWQLISFHLIVRKGLSE